MSQLFWPDWNAFGGKVRFDLGNGVLSVMKNAGGEYGIRFAFQKHFGHVVEIACTSARHHGDADGFAHESRDNAVVAGFCAVGINGVEDDFTGPEVVGTHGPFDGVEAGGLASAVGVHFPKAWPGAFCVYGDHDALGAKTFCPGGDEFGMGEGAGVDADLVCPGLEHGAHILHGANSSADGERHEALGGGAFNNIDHGRPPVCAGGDVKEDHFVGALLVVAQRKFNGVTDIAQAAILGTAELDAAGDFAVVDVETGDDALGEHEREQNEAWRGEKERIIGVSEKKNKSEMFIKDRAPHRGRFWVLETYGQSTRYRS